MRLYLYNFYRNQMENQYSTKEKHLDDPTFIQGLSRKCPNLARLDIEKMFQQSIELTQIHKNLVIENKKLQKQYNKVQIAKAERQKFIEKVEKIVKDKSEEISENNKKQSSWLVFKLQRKIDDLKKQIILKDRSIHKLKLGKQNQILFRKQMEVQCFKELTDFAELIRDQQSTQECGAADEDAIKNIVWMQQYLKSEQENLQGLQASLEQEQRESKSLMMRLANKKNQLRKMKDVMRQYTKTQESYQTEKKKKQEKLEGNKNYLTVLVKQRDEELQKMEAIKQKEEQIIQEEEEEIRGLEQRLMALQQLYESSHHELKKTEEDSEQSNIVHREEYWVRKVTLQEVQNIARNINFTLRLKKVSHQKWASSFFADMAEEYSIGEVMEKLREEPFGWENEQERKLIARYVVEDQDQGLMLEDLQTSQNAPIIKSILTKLIGDIKIFSNQEIQELSEQVGNKLFKLSSLVGQAIQLKQGSVQLLGEQKLREGIDMAGIQLTNKQIQFTLLYLFSWSGDMQKLKIKMLGDLINKGINWLGQ